MTTYRTIASTEIDADSPVTATLMTALANNPTSIAEGATGAVINSAIWHPYDGTYVGDSTGVMWDAATDGSVASVDSASFDDGYEYALILNGVVSSGSTIQISLYKDTDASWQAVTDSAAATANFLSSSTYPSYGRVIIPMPRLACEIHPIQPEFNVPPSVTAHPNRSEDYIMYDSTVQTIGAVRVSATTGSLTAGSIYLYRRRELFSG